MAAARLQRWAVLLSGYDFYIVFRDSAGNANVDFFSRFPIQSRQADNDFDPDEHYVCATTTDELPITAAEIAEGMCRIKALPRSVVWWPGIDLDIEDKDSDVCNKAHHAPKAVPSLLWPWSTKPWQKIHVDYAEVKGQQFLLVVDSHSKWMKCFL